MDARRVPTVSNALALVMAPFAGLVAAVAHPALRSSPAAELQAVAQHPSSFYVYAAGILISSILLVPALFGILSLVRPDHPRAYVAGAIAQLGMLIAIGDAATEMYVWQMGSTQGATGSMVTLLDHYETATGVATFYNVGALAMLGVFVVAVVLWRGRLAPRWAAVGLAACLVLNMIGFAVASKSFLVASYVVMLVAFSRLAQLVLQVDESPQEIGLAYPSVNATT